MGTEFVANQWKAPLSYKGASCSRCYFVWRSKLDLFEDASKLKCPNCILRPQNESDTTLRPCPMFQSPEPSLMSEIRPLRKKTLDAGVRLIKMMKNSRNENLTPPRLARDHDGKEKT